MGAIEEGVEQGCIPKVMVSIERKVGKALDILEVEVDPSTPVELEGCISID